MSDEDIDWFVENLPRMAKSDAQWKKLVKSVNRCKEPSDLEEIRAAAEDLHDPRFGREAPASIAPRLEDLVLVINARLRKLTQ